MKRQVTGILAASAAAPYLGTLSFLIDGVFGPSHSSHLLYAGEVSEGLVLVLTFGTLGLLIYGLPLILASSIAAAILHVLKAEKPALPIGLGSLAGLSFAGFLMESTLQEGWLLLMGCFISGAICGWIYWRVATRQTPESARPITNP